eukprot:941222-Amphidinium_carterae.1
MGCARSNGSTLESLTFIEVLFAADAAVVSLIDVKCPVGKHKVERKATKAQSRQKFPKETARRCAFGTECHLVFLRGRPLRLVLIVGRSHT